MLGKFEWIKGPLGLPTLRTCVRRINFGGPNFATRRKKKLEKESNVGGGGTGEIWEAQIVRVRRAQKPKSHGGWLTNLWKRTRKKIVHFFWASFVIIHLGFCLFLISAPWVVFNFPRRNGIKRWKILQYSYHWTTHGIVIVFPVVLVCSVFSFLTCLF